MNLTALFGGLIFGAIVLSSQSGGTTIRHGTSVQADAPVHVDRSGKGDRLASAERRLVRPIPVRPRLPAACDGIVSPLASPVLARVAARCDS
jgi:hypothetical protein